MKARIISNVVTGMAKTYVEKDMSYPEGLESFLQVSIKEYIETGSLIARIENPSIQKVARFLEHSRRRFYKEYFINEEALVITITEAFANDIDQMVEIIKDYLKGHKPRK